ncbi:hypothetical protein [Chryseobacterium vaccae]|uniref:hypothetical protein n=1 Tax=Chryseobacterium vaccae TaxID=2604424 RepID=UPI00129555B0|nr:hypothetical protein [Chryseobacterium vaccae]
MTQQIRDALLYKDKEYYLNNEILEYYFNEFPERKPENTGGFSACWRGYVAFFEIKNNELIIRKINCLFNQEREKYEEAIPYFEKVESNFKKEDTFNGCYALCLKQIAIKTSDEKLMKKSKKYYEKVKNKAGLPEVIKNAFKET